MPFNSKCLIGCRRAETQGFSRIQLPGFCVDYSDHRIRLQVRFLVRYEYKGYSVTIVSVGSLREGAAPDWRGTVKRSEKPIYTGPRRRSESEARRDAESWVDSQSAVPGLSG